MCIRPESLGFCVNDLRLKAPWIIVTKDDEHARITLLHRGLKPGKPRDEVAVEKICCEGVREQVTTQEDSRRDFVSKNCEEGFEAHRAPMEICYEQTLRLDSYHAVASIIRAEAAKQALGEPETLNVVADAGYSNGEQAAQCEAQGIVPHLPGNRAVNNQADGKLFDRSLFVYDETTDTFRCPAQQTLVRKQLSRKDRCVVYGANAQICGGCPVKDRCTTKSRRLITPSARRHPDAYEPARNARGDAATTMHGRAAVRAAEVGALRTPALP